MSSNKAYADQAPGATGVDLTHPAEAGYRLDVLDPLDARVRPAGDAPPRRKIAIVGFAASTRAAAPFDDPAYEIWGLNQLYRHVPRATRWFDIHANWREDNVDGTDHPGWLEKCGIPVYMTQREPSIPTSVRYPIERVIERVVGCDYETSTVAFMVALAILEIDGQVEAELAGYDASAMDDPMTSPLKIMAMVRDAYAQREIAIFGIDLIVGTEYEHQKPCVEYMLGLAHARGIVVRIPPQSALLKQRWRYGYETEPRQSPIKLAEITKRAEALGKERNNLLARLQTIDGAIQENGYWGQVADLRLKGGEPTLNEST